MNILNTIVADKRKSLAEKMRQVPLERMMAESAAASNPPSIKKAVNVVRERAFMS